MTTIDRCIQERNWGELARITSENIKAKKLADKKELIKQRRKQGEEALMYEIDKGKKIKLRKR